MQPNIPTESVTETRLEDGMIRWALDRGLRPRDLTPPEKIALEKLNSERSEKAQIRQETCWWCGKLQATRWVHHVGFDFKGDKAELGSHTQISSDDYPGPVPGFCAVCYDGPRNLAMAVYFDQPPVQFGVRATRWYVQFTDGSKEGGEIHQHPAPPKVIT